MEALFRRRSLDLPKHADGCLHGLSDFRIEVLKEARLRNTQTKFGCLQLERTVAERPRWRNNAAKTHTSIGGLEFLTLDFKQTLGEESFPPTLPV